LTVPRGSARLPEPRQSGGGNGSGLDFADSVFVGCGVGDVRGSNRYSALPDLDGDGLWELALGRPGWSDQVWETGRVCVFSGATVARGGWLEPEDALLVLVGEALSRAGTSVAGGGDFDGDGLLLVGAPAPFPEVDPGWAFLVPVAGLAGSGPVTAMEDVGVAGRGSGH